MATKRTSFTVGLLCIVLLQSCSALRTPGPPVTLTTAVQESVNALKLAERKAKEHGNSWGLLPAEVTLTYNISNELTKKGGVQLGVPLKAVSVGGDVSLAETTQRGNTIVMKFTRGGR